MVNTPDPRLPPECPFVLGGLDPAVYCKAYKKARYCLFNPESGLMQWIN